MLDSWLDTVRDCSRVMLSRANLCGQFRMTPIENYIESEDEAALAELKDISVVYHDDPREYDVVFVRPLSLCD